MIEVSTTGDTKVLIRTDKGAMILDGATIMFRPHNGKIWSPAFGLEKLAGVAALFAETSNEQTTN